MADYEFGDVLTDGRVNAVLAWVLCSLFAISVVKGVMTADYLWSGFAVFVGFMTVLPALAARNPRRLPPWEVVLLAGLPVTGRAVATVPTTNTVGTYLSLAALALLVAVNLHLFTAVEMSFGFAVMFVVVTTLAAAGVWAVVRWVSDLYLGTGLLLDPTVARDRIETQLMWEFVGASVAGLVAGVVFEVYVRRRARVGTRLQGGEFT
jgi:hypothetical protein